MDGLLLLSKLVVGLIGLLLLVPNVIGWSRGFHAPESLGDLAGFVAAVVVGVLFLLIGADGLVQASGLLRGPWY